MVLASLGSVSLAGPATAAPSSSPTARGGVDLRVDSNLDGKTDASVAGGVDEAAEGAGTALVLPNLDDDGLRCRATLKGKPAVEVKDTVLAGCSDGSDRKVNGSRDALDLAQVRSLPVRGLGPDAIGRLTVSDGDKRARMFLRQGGRWTHLPSGSRLTRAQLRRGLRLGVEARDVVRDLRWDGELSVRLVVRDGSASIADVVRMRVAPFLTHHHNQATDAALVMEPGDDDDRRAFNAALGSVVEQVGVPGGLRELNTGGDPWVQDLFEPGYVSMPRGDGTQAMRLIMRSDQARDGGRVAYELRGRDVGVLSFGRLGSTRGGSTLDSTGNLETIPPYSLGEQRYPAGRVIMGRRVGQQGPYNKPSARVTAMLRAQKVQAPLMLDTSFLVVGHVDEMFQFVPADNTLGWRLVAASPQDGVALLREAQGRGEGNSPVLRRDSDLTIDEALGSGPRSLLGSNATAARVIDSNIEILKRETGLTDADITRLPALFSRYGQDPSGDEPDKKSGEETTVPKQDGSDGLLGPLGAERAVGTEQAAFVPGAVNGLFLGPADVIVPKQWSVNIGGQDLFGAAVREAYSEIGIAAHFVNNWEVLHVGRGEIHCGTNTLRAMTEPWW